MVPAHGPVAPQSDGGERFVWPFRYKIAATVSLKAMAGSIGQVWQLL